MSSNPFFKPLADVQEIIVISDDEDELNSGEKAESGCVPSKRQRTSGEAYVCEQEHKERKKLKEKERRVQAKAAQRLLTKAKNLMAKAHIEASLKTLKEQGIEVLQIGEKEKTTPTMDRRNSNQCKKPEEEEKKVEETVPQIQLEILGSDNAAATEQNVQQKETSPTEPTPEEDDDVKDVWDETSSEEEDYAEETIEEKMKMDMKVQLKTGAPKKPDESSSSDSNEEELSYKESYDEDSSESEDGKSDLKENVIASLQDDEKGVKFEK